MGKTIQKHPSIRKINKRMSNLLARTKANQNLRRKQRILMTQIPLLSEDTLDEINHIVLREVSDVWKFRGEGLAFHHTTTKDEHCRK